MDLFIPNPQKPKIIKKDGNTAVIEINDLYPGYGTTLGNSLRSILYSSLSGSAIVSVKIDSILHEFSTIEGVLEDILEISLNLKSVRLIMHTDEPQTITIDAKGKKTITAKDIKTPSQVEIVNKDAHIATLTAGKSNLKAEMVVEKGLGYVQTEQSAKDKKEIGVIRLDAIFSPVVKVNFDVENMRVGDRIDYNKLLLEIQTDGTITPEDAYEKAVDVLISQFSAIKEIVNKGDVKKPTKKRTTTKATK